MASFEFDHRIDAPADLVWDVLTDHRGYAAWGAAQTSMLEVEGVGDVNGVGAIRRLAEGPLVVREKVLEFEPKTRFVYTVIGGPPVRDYRATVRLEPEEGATRVRWNVEFHGKVPFTGPLLKPVVKHVIRTLLKKATAEATRRARG